MVHGNQEIQCFFKESKHNEVPDVPKSGFSHFRESGNADIRKSTDGKCTLAASLACTTRPGRNLISGNASLASLTNSKANLDEIDIEAETRELLKLIVTDRI